MDVKTYLTKQLESMWNLQKSSLESVTDAVLMQKPAGTLSPIGVIWLHMLNSQDNFTAMLSGKTTLWRQGWAETFGLEKAPNIGEDWTPYYGTPLSVAQLRAYEEAVHAFTQSTLDALDEQALDETIKMFTDHDPKADVWVLMIGHTLLHSGEIAAAKGSFGKRGLPF